ncbi:hypothetical protein ABI125_14220 [Tamlana crocina]
MSNLLHRNTNRCHLIQNVSKNIWEDIISLHSTGQESSEIYYTKKIISFILTHTKSWNYSIFAKEPGLEKKWGSDIDIYIERGVDDFLLYAFQAKLLKIGQTYSDLNRHSNGSYQYQKLENYGIYKSCYVNYLFYNGVANYTYSGNNKCRTAFNEEQYGLSYTSIDNIKSVISNKASWNFNFFHPNRSSPLSELVCCKNQKENGIKSYNHEEIGKELNNYERLDSENIEEYFSKAIDSNASQDLNKNDEQKSERNADIVLVIRNTTSTY